MACIASQVFEFWTGGTIVVASQSRVDEQYVGYIYDDILESKWNFFTLLVESYFYFK